MLEIVLIITLYYLLFSTEMSFTHFASKYKIFLNISTMYTYLTSFCYIKYISRKFKLRPIQSDVDICFLYAHSRCSTHACALYSTITPALYIFSLFFPISIFFSNLSWHPLPWPTFFLLTLFVTCLWCRFLKR